MIEKIDDLHLPTAVVARLIKEALPQNATISKEAKTAISRAATVFAIYLISSVTTIKLNLKHKTVRADDILEVMKELEFENFVEPLKEQLDKYRKVVKDKKDAKAENKNKKDRENSVIENTIGTEKE